MDGTFRYLNTDLDLGSADDLTPIANALRTAGVYALHVMQNADASWHATFETNEQHVEMATNVAAMVDAVEAFGPSLRAAWDRCTLREFNVGYDCGEQPWAFNQGLPATLLGRMAAVGASLRITLYPDDRLGDEPRPDDAEDDDELSVNGGGAPA